MNSPATPPGSALGPVRTEVRGRAGFVVLARPEAINALTTDMLRVVGDALARWEHDDAVDLVVIDGEGHRGLCAGGDLRSMWASARAGDDVAPEFFRVEYRVNAAIARYPKPVVSLLDGIVMGGGVGLASHASVRLVTERAKVAMPEVGIGLVPDVGGTYLLSRAPGGLGRHLALTGAAMGAGDAIAAGLADHFIGSEQLDHVRAALAERPLREVLDEVVSPPPAAPLAAAAWVRDCYAPDGLDEVLVALASHADPDARAAAELIATRSPTAVAVTFEALRRAGGLATLEEVLEQEYAVSCACLRTHDLVEGIRAQVIDKDRQPAWNPSSLADVDAGQVAGFFREPASGPLGLVVG